MTSVLEAPTANTVYSQVDNLSVDGIVYHFFLDKSPARPSVIRDRYIGRVLRPTDRDRELILCQQGGLESCIQDKSLREVALVKFVQEGDEWIIVYQIQGVYLGDGSNGSAGLKLPPKWPVPHLLALLKWSKKSGLRRLNVQKAEHHFSYYSTEFGSDDEVREHQKRMRSIYNGTAKKIGCRWDPITQLYIVELQK